MIFKGLSSQFKLQVDQTSSQQTAEKFIVFKLDIFELVKKLKSFSLKVI
jgi:hypothetical protein